MSVNQRKYVNVLLGQQRCAQLQHYFSSINQVRMKIAGRPEEVRVNRQTLLDAVQKDQLLEKYCKIQCASLTSAIVSFSRF